MPIPVSGPSGGHPGCRSDGRIAQVDLADRRSVKAGPDLAASLETPSPPPVPQDPVGNPGDDDEDEQGDDGPPPVDAVEQEHVVELLPMADRGPASP
ncbi:MAG TPA: hypothetical protein VEG38_09125 [Acidimicrobiia bacterium]|nr:hypothetical protein [Acidimicrobiia bacterium]